MLNLSRGVDERILNLIPHRDPFLFIEKIEQYSASEIVTSLWLDPSSCVFKGHFPEYPILPGVIMVEGMAQSGGVFGGLSLQSLEKKVNFFFYSIENVKFRNPALPGDTIFYKVSIEKIFSQVAVFKGEVVNQDQKRLVEAQWKIVSSQK